MKYYIDFDHTMFDTMKFNEARYNVLEEYKISKEIQKKEEEQIVKEDNILFNVDYVYSKICDKYNLPKEEILHKLHELFDRCYEFLYEDTIEFLEYLKIKGNQIYLLTWGDKEYQTQKVKGTKIEKYFDEIIYTEKMKFSIDINYRSGIFIDDNPRDLEGLYNNNALKVIRIKREDAKYSNKPINVKIEEYKSLRDLKNNI